MPTKKAINAKNAILKILGRPEKNENTEVFRLTGRGSKSAVFSSTGRYSFSALFSAHMLVSTKSGEVYSKDQYCDWMKKYGFRNIMIHPISKHKINGSLLIVGTKLK